MFEGEYIFVELNELLEFELEVFILEEFSLSASNDAVVVVLSLDDFRLASLYKSESLNR